MGSGGLVWIQIAKQLLEPNQLGGVNEWTFFFAGVYLYVVVPFFSTFLRWVSSWWLNQPSWKICSSNWIISPSRGEKKNPLKPPARFFSRENLKSQQGIMIPTKTKTDGYSICKGLSLGWVQSKSLLFGKELEIHQSKKSMDHFFSCLENIGKYPCFWGKPACRLKAKSSKLMTGLGSSTAWNPWISRRIWYLDHRFLPFLEVTNFQPTFGLILFSGRVWTFSLTHHFPPKKGHGKCSRIPRVFSFFCQWILVTTSQSEKNLEELGSFEHTFFPVRVEEMAKLKWERVAPRVIDGTVTMYWFM